MLVDACVRYRNLMMEAYRLGKLRMKGQLLRKVPERDPACIISLTEGGGGQRSLLGGDEDGSFPALQAVALESLVALIELYTRIVR